MMNSHFGNPHSRARVLVFRLSGARSGWLAKLGLFVLIPLALLFVVGVWAVLAIGAAAVAVTALVVAPLVRRLRGTPAAREAMLRGRVLDGEARRIDAAD